nr:MAG TPA: crystallin beta/gamma motif-containing protein [Caudoviricetes sp.]
MAFDLEGYLSDANARQEKRQEQEQERAAAEAEAAKPLYEKAWDAAGEAWDAVKDTANDVVTTAITSGTRFANAYGQFLDERMASNEPRHEFMNRPDVQETVDELGSSAADFVLSPVRIVADRATRPLRSYIGSRIEQSADEGSEFAQDLRSTETFVNYFMTDEERLRKAREIEANTGISADSFMDDDIAYKQALKINDYTQKKRELMQDNFSMEAVWQEFPEIRDIAKMNPRDAALALHDIESVRQTHGIVETFTHFLELGNKRLEFNNLMYKVFLGTADDNDLQRAADLDKMIEEDTKTMPSFWDDPLAAIAGGMASSGPEMLQSVREGIRDGLIMAEATAAATAAAGTAIEPGGGTLIGGVGGAGAGFAVGTIRSMSARTGIITAARATFANASRNQLIRAAAGAGMREGMFEGMRRPETGERYAEYRAMKDVDGNPLNTDDQARAYALVGGAINPAIEMMNFGLVTKPLRGLNLLGKEGAEGYAEKAIRGIVDQAKYDIGKSESVVAFAKNHIKDALKIAGTESAEESAQSLSDDLIHNSIVASSDGRAADKAYSIGDMAVNAIVSGAEAFPVGLGFGMASSVGAVPGVVRHAQRLSSEKTREDIAAQRTMTGTIMLDRLQQVASSAKLKQTAPDVQQKIIRAQASGTGFENAYIDTETALQKENGLADLKEVAKAAGIRDEELENTIKNGGHLFVPIEKYAQSAASPQLLESVSFSPETDSLARMKKNAKDLSDEVEQAQKNAIKAKTDIIHAITNEWFPEAPDHASDKEKLRRSSEREMAIAAITQDQDSPASGWRKLYNEFVADRDELLRPAMDALQRGMGNGVDIVQNGEDGRGIRVSNNEPWYQDFYKENGRAPRKGELMDLAYRLTVGDASAPKIEGWAPASQEDIDAMEGAKGQLDELNDYIKTLENIKDRMMQVDAAEIKGTAGLSPEAYSVYRQIMAQLKAIGGQQSRAARMNALLFAHHADQFARVMREKQGNENYTAMDYMQERFGLRSGGKYTEEGDALQQAARAGLNLDEQVHVVDLDVLTNNLKGKTDKDILNYISKASLLPEVPTADFQALVGLPKDSDSYGQRHLVRGNANRSSDNRTARNITLSNFADIAKNAVVVEVVPNAKKAPLTGLKGKKRQAQKRKNQISNYYRIMVPVQMNGHIKTLVIVAEEHDGVVSTGSVPVTAYEIYYAKKPPLAATPRPKTGVSAAEEEAPLTISIRDMLTGVKDADGNVYAQSAWHGSPHDFDAFDLGGIGTGEGAQAHGWGLYFAGERNTSEGYKERLTARIGGKYGEILTYDGKPINKLKGDLRKAFEIVSRVYDPPFNPVPATQKLVKSAEETVRINEDRIHDLKIAIAAFDENPNLSTEEILEMIAPRLSGDHVQKEVKRGGGELREDVIKALRSYQANDQISEQAKKEVQIVLDEFNRNLYGSNETIWESTKNKISDDRIASIFKSPKQFHTREDALDVLRQYKTRAEKWVVDSVENYRLLKLVDPQKVSLQEVKGFLYEVEIPDNDVLLDEQKTMREQPPKVQEGIRKILREMVGQDVSLTDGAVSEYTGKTLVNYLGRTLKQKGSENPHKDASLLLNEAGIKGITYDGRRDGRCYVIFDDKAISIIEKYHQQLQREVYGEISQENGKRIITLFEGANESTMLHEMGHMFLMDLDELAEMDETSAKDQATVNEWAEWKPGAAEEYKDTDWKDEFWKYEQDIIAAEKSGDAVAIKSAKERWRQERFARGFEIYLHDGKAPSKALRGVFRKFKQFLRKLYKFVENVGGKPSAEVEAVMARMIASEEEIKAAELDERYRPIERLGGKETLENLLGKSIAETYQKWLKESRDDAEDRLRAEVMKDLKKEAREEYNEKVEAERTRKREELESDPVYLAEMALKNGGKEAAAIIGNWFPSMQAYKEARAKRKSIETELTEYMTEYARGLDKEILQARLTDENIAKAMQTPKAYHRRVALEAAGMRAKERLMRRLDDRIQDAVKGALDALNDVPEDTDLRKEQDGEAMKKIMAAVQNLRSSGKWTPEEYKRLEEMTRATSKKEMQKKLQAFWNQNYKKVRESLRKENKETWRRKNFDQQVWENDKFIREQARMVLADLPISESCNPAYFRRKERQHARAVDKALSQERWDIAYAEKEQQALAAACAYEATKNEEKLNQMKADVQRKLGARTVRLAAAERYWLHHIAYLLGLKGSDVEKPEGYIELGALFESYKNNLDMDADAPTEILEMLSKENSSYRKMKLGEFTQAVNMLKALYTIGRDKNRMLSVGGKDFDDIVREILASTTSLTPEGVVQHPVSPDTGGLGYSDWLAKVPGIGEQLAILGQKGAMPLIKPEILIRLLGEEAHRYLYGTYERAQMREAELLGQSQKELERILSAYSKKERMEWKDRNIDVGGDKLSKENIICLALNWGTETNRKRVIDGIGQRLDVQGVFAKYMTERDWKAVQQIWDFVDTFWKETAEVEEKLNGSHLGKVPASAFRVETSDGKEITMRGGYYPLKYNPEKSTQAKEKEVEDQAQKTLAGARVLGTGRSHVKERSENDVKEPLLLEFRVLQEHVYNAAHNIAFRVAARDVHRIVRNAEFKAYVTSTYGMPFWNSLDQWVLDTWAIAADGSSDRAATAISRTMAALRRNSTMAIMGWRLWPVVENASNIGPMMDKLGAVEANAAIADYYANKKEMDDLLHKSIFMSDRINNMERDLRHDKRLFDPTYTPVEVLRDNAYWALAQTDLMLSKPLWCRAYKNAFPEMLAEVNRENEENKRAYQEAQENVERLRAETYDMRKELYYLRDEAEERRYMNPERMRESKYAALSDQELIEEQQRWETKIKDREKEFYEAGHRLERASELPIREGREIIEEAELRAVQKADAAVRDVFGSGQTKDLAEVQRSRNEAVKMLTSFYSFFNTQFNAILEAHFKGKYDAHGYKYMHVWMPLARAVIYRIVLVTLIGAGLKFALGLEGDDEKDRYRTVKDPKTGETKKEEVSDYERFMSVFGKNLLSTGTGTLPIVRDVAGLIGSAVFDGTTYGRNFELGSVLTRGAKQVQATVNLMIQKGKKDLEREEKEAKERERVKKMTPKQRKAYEEAKKYKKPEKEIGYLDIAKSAAQAASTFTAAQTGVTNTITDGIFSALQYAADMMETDNYYDRDFRNVMRSVLFDKKLRAEEPPPKPEKPKKPKKNTRAVRGK